jgi:hypothetical protein
MSNNNDLIDRLETQSARLKAHEEVERLKFQLTQERTVHAQTRGKLKDARDALKSECMDHVDTERRKEREAAALRGQYNEAVIRWDEAGYIAGAASGLVAGLVTVAVVCVTLDAVGLMGLGGLFLASVSGLLLGFVVRTRVYTYLVRDGE